MLNIVIVLVLDVVLLFVVFLVIRKTAVPVTNVFTHSTYLCVCVFFQQKRKCFVLVRARSTCARSPKLYELGCEAQVRIKINTCVLIL